ncbi:hypothetical protein [Coprothermobacter platensis]|uniref:hypothetical protein n=1 Tax=Coprothermobacter platensis TaxID=108819 RepID=UPI0003792D9F|nr:hypothetical protein [Coprothermobacter platensis]
MSPIVRFILTIVLTAIVGIIVFIWGMRKEQELPRTLTKQLLAKARSTILAKLKKQGEGTREDMEKWLDGLIVGPMWSSRRVKVTDPSKVVEILLPILIEQDDIEEERREGRSFYRIKKRK